MNHQRCLIKGLGAAATIRCQEGGINLSQTVIDDSEGELGKATDGKIGLTDNCPESHIRLQALIRLLFPIPQSQSERFVTYFWRFVKRLRIPT